LTWDFTHDKLNEGVIMPKIHQYVDGRGHYIKSAFKGVITTYQVSPDGEAYLSKLRIRDGNSIDVEKLLWMQKKGYIYTEGSGPGEIEPSLADEDLFIVNRPGSAKQTLEKVKNKDKALLQNSSTGCLKFLILILVSILFLAIVFSFF